MKSDKKSDKNSLLLYLVTDKQGDSETLYKQVTDAIKGGVTFVQFREKNSDEPNRLRDASKIKELCHKHNIPFVINDDVSLALKTDADGVHIGQDDISLAEARKFLGEDKIIGVSVQTPEQAALAESGGADYLGVGAVFHTDSKSDASDVSIPLLKEICSSVNIPVVAIGGINKDNVNMLANTGICGIAVISAILSSDDVQNAARDLKILTKRWFKND